MITTDFLPDSLNIPAVPPYSVKLTDSVDDLALSYPDGWPDAYWYGWLRWENIPDCLKISLLSCSGSGTDRTVSANSIAAQNMNVGYVATGCIASSIYWYGMIQGAQVYSDNSGFYHDPVNNVSPFMGSRFINKLDPRGICGIHGGASAALENKIGFVMQLQRIYGDDTDGYNNWSMVDIAFDDVANGINKFLAGDITRELVKNGYAVYDNSGYTAGSYNISYTLDINSPDFGAEHPNVWTHRFTQSGYSFILQVFMCGFGFPVGADKINENDSYQYETLRLTPIFSQEIAGDRYISVGAQNYYNFATYDITNSLITEPGTTCYIDSDYVYGGFYGSVTIAGNGANNYGITFDENANFAVIIDRVGPNINKTRVFRIMTAEEMMHTETLNIRYVTNDDYTYSSYGFGSGIYVPHISEENEFLCEWLTGDFEDIQEQLRPWQYGDITDNEYSPEDLPPYEPPYDGERFGGDSIRPFDFTNTVLSASNNFVTLYALSSDFIQAFGQAMWSDLGDPNFWHMVGVEFSNDFSINPADMMKYFISLRYYPIDLTPYSSYEGGVYIGRATQAIEPGAATLPYRISQNVIHIDGGSVEVRMDHFNTDDFRVYDPNTQVTVYVPYCGNVQLAASEVYGSTLYLDYTLDMQTGSMKACISTSQSETSYNLIATLSGSIGADIQITANNNIEFLQRIASVVTGTVTQTGSMAMQGAMAGGEVGAAVGAVAGALTGGVSSLASLPPVTVHKQGTAAGFANLGGANRAYITIQTGIYDVPNDFGKVHGWRCNIIRTIGSVSGFTVCSDVNTDGLTCTGDEAAEIKRILESGFYA